MLRRLLLTIFAFYLAPTARGETEPAPLRASEAVEVFHCAFDEEWDVNYDGWPDRWRRAEGPDFPHYVQMEIEEAPGATHERALVIRLDGSRAEVATPPIGMAPRFAYLVEAQVRVSNVQHTTVRFRIDFLNAAGVTLQSELSEPIASAEGWQRVPLGTQRTLHPGVTQAVARVTAEPGRRGDLFGEVALGDVWVARMPSMTITTNNIYNVYDNPDDVVVTCSMSGIRERDPDIRFQLLDATDREIGDSGAVPMDGKLIVEESFKGSHIASQFEGSNEWRPRIAEPGFYRVRAQMVSSVTGEVMHEKRVSLAVLPKLAHGAESEFGWSLNEIDWSESPIRPALASKELQKLLPMVGIGWAKLPVWFPAEDSARGDRIVQFVEQLAAHDIEAVGLLMATPPTDPEDKPVQVGRLFAGDVSAWLPMWDHVMTRLSLRVRWWQLGGEYDVSMMGDNGALAEQVELIRSQLFRFGQDVRLGLGWRWDQPASPTTPWEFQQMSSAKPPTEPELEAWLQQSPPSSADRWVLIEPAADDPSLSTELERHQERVRRFVQQMVTAKMHGVSGAFVAEPFSGPRGVMDENGTPGELLLPWRTTARLLGGAEYIGRLQLPGGSENRLFLRSDGNVVMVLWNETPTNEALYLGQNVVRYDIWGRSAPVPLERGEQVVSASRMPSFVIGLHEGIARWRMSIALADEYIPSVFGHEHPNELTLTNGFRPGVGTVSGAFRFFVPDQFAVTSEGKPAKSAEWDIDVPNSELRIPVGETVVVPIAIGLKQANYGPQLVRIDFDLQADQRYTFSAWRTLHVGRGDVRFDVETFLDKNDRLIVVQKMVNEGGDRPPDFKCLLYTAGRRRQRQQVFKLGPDGDEKRFVYSDGAALVGQEMTLRLEEIDGERTLIHRFQAKAGTPPVDKSSLATDADPNDRTTVRTPARPFTPAG